MSVKEVNDLISLMACVSCSEMDGSMCDNYNHQVNEFLKKYPEEVKTNFMECWISVSRCASVNKKPSKMWQSVCDGIIEETATLKERIRIRKSLDVIRDEVIPDYLQSEVAEFKGNAKSSGDPVKYLTDCIADWMNAAISNADMVY